MRTTAKDLRFNAKGVLETVSRGEEVVITFRGKPCAKIVPYEKQSNDKTKKNELFGIWQDNDAVENVDDYVQGLRKGRS